MRDGRKDVVELFHIDGMRALGVERVRSGRHFVHQDSQGIQVGPCIGRGAPDLLRTHIERRTQSFPDCRFRFQSDRPGPGDAEIKNQDRSIVVNSNIGRFQVAVNDLVVVGTLQSPADLSRDRNNLRLGHGTRPFYSGGQIFVFHIVHDQVSKPAGPADVENFDNVGVL